jgi:hypothetical protein
VSTNPFAAKAAAAEGSFDEAPAAPLSVDEWAAPAADEAAPEELAAADADEAFGEFEPPAKPSKGEQRTVPYNRLAKVIAERNEAREEKGAVELALERARGEVSAYKKLDEIVTATKYRENPELLKFDHSFMSEFEKLAQTDQKVADAAAIVQAAMKGLPVTEKPAVSEAAQAAPAADPAVAKLIEKAASASIASALEEKGVKPHFVKAVIRDVLAHVDAADLTDVTPAQAVELAKAYFAENEVPSTEFLVPKKAGSSKPNVSGSGRPAATTAAAAAGEGEGEHPTFKNREEFDADRSKRFSRLAREAFGQ